MVVLRAVLSLLLVYGSPVNCLRSNDRLLWPNQAATVATGRYLHGGIQPFRDTVIRARQSQTSPASRNSVHPTSHHHSADGRPPKRAPHLDHRCLDPATKFSCGTCMTVVMCIGNFAYEYSCPSDCPMCREDPAFQGAVCKATPSPICDCKNAIPATSVWPDPFDYSAFLACDAGTLTVGRCTPGFQYIKETNKCAPLPPFPACMQIATTANKYNCQFYQHCLLPAAKGVVTFLHQVVARCSDPKHAYSPSKRACVDPHTMPHHEVCAAGHVTPKPPTTHRPPITKPPGTTTKKPFTIFPPKPVVPVVPKPPGPGVGGAVAGAVGGAVGGAIAGSQPAGYVSVAQIKRIILEALSKNIRPGSNHRGK